MPGPRLLVCAIVCSFLSSALFAQQATSVTTLPGNSDPQAIALLQKSLAALTHGESVTDVTLTGTAHRIAGSDDETGTVTLEATSAGDSRVELSFSSGNRIEIRNHSAFPLPGALPSTMPASVAQMPQPVGAWSGPDGILHGMASHNLMTDAAWFFPALALERLAASKTYVLSYFGQETHNGAVLLHVSAMQQFAQNTPTATGGNTVGPNPSQLQELVEHLSQMDFYFDPNTLLPAALDFDQHPDGNALSDIPVEVRFSDYESVNGIAAPMDIQKYVNYGLALDLQISDTAINSGLPASAFAVQ